MMSSLRGYLISVCAVSILISLLQSMIPSGKVKRVADLAGGLLLLIVVISPIVGLQEYHFYELPGLELSEQERRKEQYLFENREAMAAVITEKCTEYILDKAEMLGMDVDVDLKLEWSDAVSYPVEATLRGEFSNEQRSSMTSILEEEFGIPASKQEWIK